MKNKFWQFALMMLHHRRLLIFGFAGAMLDAICKLGGFGTLTWVIKQFLDRSVTLHGILTEKLVSLRDQRGLDLTGILSYLPSSPMGGLALTLSVVLLLTAIGSAGRFTHVYCTQTASLKTVARIRRRVFARLIYMPMGHMIQGRSAERLSRVVRDSRQVASGFSLLSGKAVRGLLSGTALLVGAFILDWWLTLLFLIVVPPAFLMNHRFGRKVKGATKKKLDNYGRLLGMVSESLQGARVVKIHHAESHERRRFRGINHSMLNKEMKARVVKALAAPMTELITMLGVMGVILVAAWGFYSSDIDLSATIGVLVMLIGSASSFRTLANLNIQLQMAIAGAENLDEALTAPTELPPLGEGRRNTKRLSVHTQSVTFDRVAFTYPKGEQPVLREVSLEVLRGERCAIVGPNGSGKTTLMSLLPRLFEPDSGRILVDGQDIADYSLRSLRRQIAVVTQETTLFAGSAAENIRYNMHQASDDDLVRAASIAHADDFIRELPEGYDTRLGERGLRLSGGQRQRLAIARAILRDPAILILDEATSQIDAHSEALIGEALDQFSKGRTTFVIAHRLSTVIHADQIVVMVDGRVESIGRHEALLQTSAVYRDLNRTQLQPGGEY